MSKKLYPDIPEPIPRKGNTFSRWLGCRLLCILRWRIVGVLPAEPKVVVAIAPHTSNWDFITAMAGVMALGIDVKYLMKKEAFIWPLSTFFVWSGGVPLDRKDTKNAVDQIVTHFQVQEKLWVAIAPEGTRKKVACWKTGFLRIARKANVPLLLVAWNYPKRELVIDCVWSVSEDVNADEQAIRQYVSLKFRGRHPQQQ